MSLLDTYDEVLVNAPLNTPLNPHHVITAIDPLLEDQKVMSFLTELRNLKVLREIVIYDSKIGLLKEGNIDQLVLDNMARLPYHLDRFYSDPLGRHDVDKAFYEEGFVVIKNPEKVSDKPLALYVTQNHYLTF